MQPSLSRDQARAFDAAAMRHLGLPGAVLMENAGRGAAEHILHRFGLGPSEVIPGTRAVVLCGGGNNGGDGYVVARHLHIAGLGVELYSTVGRERLGGDAAMNRDAAALLGLEVRSIEDAESLARADERWSGAGVLVDGLLGTGFQGELREPLAAVLRAANAAQVGRRVSLDLPSGLDCDTGKAADPTFRADLTVTFVARKRGFDAPGAEAWTGRVVVAGIGVPPSWRPPAG